MTGYGRSESQNQKQSCIVEIRSVNNRHMEIKTKLPRYLNQLELPLKKLVKSKCSRGSLDISITLDKNEGSSSDHKIKPDLKLAFQYFEAINQIKGALSLTGEIDINTVLSIKDLIKFEAHELDSSQEEMITKTVEEALEALTKMRDEEGRNLQSDISVGLIKITNLADHIQSRQPIILKEYQEKLRDRINTLSEGIPLDEARLAQEIAIMADRCDVTEELSRLRSHLQQFNNLILKKGAIGRKLEFITQEINREANTIASKTIDYKVSQSVIELKSTLEKIREQILNIE